MKERVLARVEADDGTVLAGTAAALLLGDLRIPWQEVESADWDSDADTLRVTEVGRFGEPRGVHHYTLAEPGRLLELVRERVTASVVLQRHLKLDGDRGVRVIGRRHPAGAPTDHDAESVAWFFEYDAGIDPADPVVVDAADRLLAGARADLGLV